MLKLMLKLPSILLVVTLILLPLLMFQLQWLEKDNGVKLELLAVVLLLIKEVSLLLILDLKLLV